MKKVALIIGGILAGGLGLIYMMLGSFQAVQTCEEFVATSTTLAPENTTTSIGDDGEVIVDTPMTPEEAMEFCLFGGDGDPISELGAEISESGEQNGRLPASMLKLVSSHGNYDCLIVITDGAADAWLELVAAAQADGVDIEGGWCYRTYAEQLSLWNSRNCGIPGNCDGSPYPPTARPGTSNHGWGLAVDVWNTWDSILSCNDSEFAWMQQNAPGFGWIHPSWASCGRSSQEPWHWEFVG